ncbi:hypothetical protein FHT08_002410 [Xanthomonas campestris]|uniref:hypothetical protein n=1 Tax=Xanthomonas sp. CFBP 8151 TaxID=3035310 RepID=UPI00141B26B5|nr:hypothetical protein [Xanthomonas sp. CFBP 8151]NIJ77327.1 hypothetical protein [Xanthomonas sp. CFBP 8151]
MSKKVWPPKFWKLALVQLAMVIACAAIWFYFQAKALLAGPPIGDLYVYTWQFQLTIFFMFWLPATVLACGSLLGVEYWLSDHTTKCSS